ncbi:GNAT family N-acetyltransferase [Tenacibaculum sp. IB213877]|uniref:GNAT family N-acetyltransferase n=1 Tax=Tenacibaculum sp. IB213877 TaxID=3097351 RepID=UPI002A59E0DF|nr:GNAT family N-acetyltransferase [Tenacibaculum sp. IB213877]MDY0780515.1 GNAT family N-acetyltransferase [Tenacibaculum sp. IB213877]
MDFCKNHINARYFTSVEEIPEEIWHQLDCTHSVYFSPKYLSVIAKNHPKIQFFYLVLFDEQNLAKAFATIQIIDFYLDRVQNNFQSLINRIKCFGRSLGIISPEKPFKILTCGNTFVSGEHGIFIKNDQDKPKVLNELAKSLVNFVNTDKKLRKQISAFMLKDFIKESLVISDELHECKYSSFNVEPNMIMQVDTDWNDFNDYLSAMKTKFRVKAKKAIERSCFLEVVSVDENTLQTYKNEMQELYNNVCTKAGFNLGEFSIDTFKELKKNLGKDYIVQAYFLNSHLVGFLSGMINNQTLDAHFVGIDYQYNREYAIYQRMLYDYVQIAIERDLKTINFGRTASEIKSSVGAQPQDLTIYLRHKNTISNKILGMFIHKLQPTPFRQNFPFKVKNLVQQT